MSIKGKGHSLAFPKGYSVCKVKSFSSETVELFETKYYVKDFGSTEIKICTNGLSRMTMRVPTPIYDKKNFKNLFFQNQRTDCNETWYVAFGMPAHYSLFKL